MHNATMKICRLFPYKSICLSEHEVIRRYYKFESIYSAIVTPFFSRAEWEDYKLLFFSVMIYEDYNRPCFLRHCERMLFWLFLRINQQHLMTLGIMQVGTYKIISDMESVQIAAERLCRFINEDNMVAKSRDYKVVRFISEYNSSKLYIQEIRKLMKILESDASSILLKQFNKTFFRFSIY